jgi:DNA-binding transcriptional MerR regulator
MAIDGRYQIGEVAEQVGLSLRTIRHYEEVDLVPPSGRSAGGFRLYTDADVERLRVVKHLKPLGFSLEDMQEVLAALEEVRTAGDPAAASAARRALERFAERAEERCGDLRTKLANAEAITRTMQRVAAGGR